MEVGATPKFEAALCSDKFRFDESWSAAPLAAKSLGFDVQKDM